MRRKNRTFEDERNGTKSCENRLHFHKQDWHFDFNEIEFEHKTNPISRYILFLCYATFWTMASLLFVGVGPSSACDDGSAQFAHFACFFFFCRITFFRRRRIRKKELERPSRQRMKSDATVELLECRVGTDGRGPHETDNDACDRIAAKFGIKNNLKGKKSRRFLFI